MKRGHGGESGSKLHATVQVLLLVFSSFGLYCCFLTTKGQTQPYVGR